MRWLTGGDDVDVVHNGSGPKDELAHHLEHVGVVAAPSCADGDEGHQAHEDEVKSCRKHFY